MDDQTLNIRRPGYLCRECLGEGDGERFSPSMNLVAERLCFRCHFWLEKVLKRDDPSVARIAGQHWTVCSEDVHPSDRGMCGRRFTIVWDDGRRVVTSNLWHQGDIPTLFRERLPDNARFELDTPP